MSKSIQEYYKEKRKLSLPYEFHSDLEEVTPCVNHQTKKNQNREDNFQQEKDLLGRKEHPLIGTPPKRKVRKK